MHPKSSKVSLFGLHRHELIRGFKELGNDGVSFNDRSKSLREAEEQNLKVTIKSGISFLTLMVILENLSENDSIVLSSVFGRIEIPIVYVLFIAFIFYAGLCMGAIKSILLLTVKADLLNNFALGTRFSTPKSLLQGDSTADIISPIRNGNLFVISKLNHQIIHSIFWLMYLCIAVPAGCSTLIMFKHLANSLALLPTNSLDTIILLCSSFGVFFSTLYLVYFFVPFPIEKTYHLSVGIFYIR